MSGKRSPGQPEYDDAEAIAEIRRLKLAHPKWSDNRAAHAYAKDHPETNASVDSTARRLAGKVRRKSGRPARPQALRTRYLEELRRALYAVYKIVEKLIDLEERKR